MNTNEQQLIKTIITREKLRSMSRISRLLKDPIRALPYYLLAAVSHVQPFQVRFKTLWNTQMTCYLPEGNTFFYYGYCEANVTNFLVRYIQSGMTIIDVGAHVGFYSMLASRLVGAQGSVHSFEPTPWTFKLLKQNTTGLANVVINNKAIAETSKVLAFADYGPGYGAYNSAHENGAEGLGKKAEHIEVQSISLDAYCTEKDLSPDVIKIDSEGFEYEVLSGSKALLSHGNVRRPVVIMEVANGDAWAVNRNDSFRFLSEHDYLVHEMTVEGLLRPHEVKANYTYDNLLFIPKERQNELIDLMV